MNMNLTHLLIFAVILPSLIAQKDSRPKDIEVVKANITKRASSFKIMWSTIIRQTVNLLQSLTYDYTLVVHTCPDGYGRLGQYWEVPTRLRISFTGSGESEKQAPRGFLYGQEHPFTLTARGHVRWVEVSINPSLGVATNSFCVSRITINTDYKRGRTYWDFTPPRGLDFGNTNKIKIEGLNLIMNSVTTKLEYPWTFCKENNGYKVTDDHLKCAECDSTHYGMNCRERRNCSLCQRGCVSGTSCNCRNNAGEKLCVRDDATGICCDKTCPGNTFSSVWLNDGVCNYACKCRDGAACWAWNGHCPTGCQLGYQTRNVHTSCYFECPAGFFGEGCSIPCNCANGKPCYDTGMCPNGCDDNYMGSEGRCQTYKCVTHYGKRHGCSKECHCNGDAECDKITGKCPESTGGCHHRFYGDDCQRMCNLPKYAVDGQCTGQCGKCKDDACSVTTGECLSGCKEGWVFAPKCKTRCIYHPTCPEYQRKKCHCVSGKQDCHIELGNCTLECDLRHYGEACQHTCPSGTYHITGDPAAISCNGVCHCHRLEVDSCRAEGGSCGGLGCAKRWYGMSCEIHCKLGARNSQCLRRCYCVDEEKHCNNRDGICTGKCRDRYLGGFGTQCINSCTDITRHKQGDPKGRCDGICRCRVSGMCHMVTGHCAGGGCWLGYVAPTCEHRCAFGPKDEGCSKRCNCLHGKVCDPLNGTCPDGGNCDFRHHGDDGTCQEECPVNMYQINGKCTGTCHCANPDHCRAKDGYCVGGDCQDGYYPRPTCHIRCQYGPTKCVDVCRCREPTEPCNVVTGHCKSGCKFRYTGPGCSKTCDPTMYMDANQQKCVETCHCLNVSECHVDTGTCWPSGCALGWAGESCQQVCKYGPRNCTNKCRCYNDVVCHPLTGECMNGQCAWRYYGKDCQRRCPNGTFFQSANAICSGTCRCLNEDQCRATDGQCMDGLCKTGYDEPDCQRQCKYGKTEADNCRLPNGEPGLCNCYKPETCDPHTGHCVSGCAIRYAGSNCQKGKTCSTNQFFNADLSQCSGTCHCRNNKKCNISSGVCVGGGCDAGFRGKDCQTTCKGTKMWSYDCETRCHCKDDIQCDHEFGLCPNGECHHRYRGYACQDVCPHGRYIINDECDGICHCKNDSNCDIASGVCYGGVCVPGYRGSNNKCDKQCDKSFGQDCATECHCLDNSPCHHITGECDTFCDYRFTDTACQEYCPDGKWNWTTCDQDCLCKNPEFCRVTDGRCMRGGCKEREDGSLEDCEKACEAGLYEINATCTGVCNCRNDSICDPVSGWCPRGCVTRKYALPRGPCDKDCPEATFLEVATDDCTGVCHCADNTRCRIDDATCEGSAGCAAGWMGGDCQTACDGTTFGPNCEGVCHCQKDVKCDTKTGACDGGKCSLRYFGRLCDQTCTRNTHSPTEDGTCSDTCYCRNPDTCHVSSGVCGGGGCVAGRRGDKCDILCVNRWGHNCEHECHCLDDKTCNEETGECPYGDCAIRYTGPACQQTCPPNRYKPTNCSKRCRCAKPETCAVTDGECTEWECESVRYIGRDCQTTCRPGRYRENGTCTGICNCLLRSICHVTNGTCIGGQCAVGWRGPLCHERCQAGKYGPNCSYTCHCKGDEPCETSTGVCRGGCEEGYSGYSCESKSDKAAVEKVTLYVGIFVIIAILGILVACVALSMRNRQRTRNPPRSRLSSFTNTAASITQLEGLSSKQPSLSPSWKSATGNEPLSDGIGETDAPDKEPRVSPDVGESKGHRVPLYGANIAPAAEPKIDDDHKPGAESKPSAECPEPAENAKAEHVRVEEKESETTAKKVTKRHHRDTKESVGKSPVADTGKTGVADTGKTGGSRKASASDVFDTATNMGDEVTDPEETTIMTVV